MDQPTLVASAVPPPPAPPELLSKKYIPVGCLLLDGTKIKGSLCKSSGWIELDDQVPELQHGAMVDPLPVPSQLSDISTINDSLDLLIRTGRIAIACGSCLDSPAKEVWRVSVQSDTSTVVKAPVRKALALVLSQLNVTSVLWAGYDSGPCEFDQGLRTTYFDLWASSDDRSLFNLFNCLPSPKPSTSAIRNRYLKKTIVNLLDPSKPVRGLKTELYPFQRRSAAMMVQREVAPQLQVSPRLDRRIGPTGQAFFYNSRDQQFFRLPQFYNNVRGGILAESMGHGKTLICLAAILATKGMTPAIPPEHSTFQPIGSQVRTLRAMAAATISKTQIPWRTEFEEFREKTDQDLSSCMHALQDPPCYEIYAAPSERGTRRSWQLRPSEKFVCYSGTLVVVPKNLIMQWRSEIEKHVLEGFLKVFYMDERKVKLPSQAELASYDLVLISKERFKESEGASLQGVHWLRMIVDEGHSFQNSDSLAVRFANRLRIERRWVVSGTPAGDLLGVEVELIGDGVQDVRKARHDSLEQRKAFSLEDEKNSRAITQLGSLASEYLHVQPWSTEPSASWDEYVFRHEGFKPKRTYTSFSQCLQRTLRGLVIKTQPDDVERDMVLPALTHTIIKLEPSLYDKLTANIFVLQFVVNAVTSERVDIDYFFYAANRKHLLDLVRKMRLSAFTWSGFDEAQVNTSIEIAENYLAKENCSTDDRELMKSTIKHARKALQLPVWKAITTSDGMGVSVDGWPEGSQDLWAINEDCSDPLVMSMGRLIHAQKFINERLHLTDPADGLAGASITQRSAETNSQAATTSQASSASASVINGSDATTALKKKRKKPTRKVQSPYVELAPDLPLAQTRLVGTISAKFSYLVSRIEELHSRHKCLIFYDGNFIAYFLAEALELLHIKHLLYTSDTKVEQRSRLIQLFNKDDSQRVLLMDLKQAAHGLNITSATHVFFVNPVCRPNIEAQAIKRAHRIGQTQPVHVETLVLAGTVEEALHARATSMTAGQHRKTLEDDDEIKAILQDARVFPIDPALLNARDCMAPLAKPLQIFGRPGRANKTRTALEIDIFGKDHEVDDEHDDNDNDDENEQGQQSRNKKSKKSARRASSSPVQQDDAVMETVADSQADDGVADADADARAVSEGYTSIFGSPPEVLA